MVEQTITKIGERIEKDWDPQLYLRFRNERTQPSIDLVNRIRVNRPPRNIIDIGCGPGNSSQILAERWPSATLLGIDSSPKMIEKAKAYYPHQNWVIADASQFVSEEKFDIVFSNATIQWIPNHEKLIPHLCNLLPEQGVLAVQLPNFLNMPVGKAIERIAREPRWEKQVGKCSRPFFNNGYRFYYDLLSTKLTSIEMWETKYLHVMDSSVAIIEWVKAAGMRPYLDRLSNDSERAEFEREVLCEIEKDYPLQKDGKILFPFERLFMIGHYNSV